MGQCSGNVSLTWRTDVSCLLHETAKIESLWSFLTQLDYTNLTHDRIVAKLHRFRTRPDSLPTVAYFLFNVRTQSSSFIIEADGRLWNLTCTEEALTEPPIARKVEP